MLNRKPKDANIMVSFNIFILPSYREGFPKVIMEASYIGRAIITTDVPGCRDVIEDSKNGFICNVKDVTDLSNSIERFIYLSNEERDKMGQFGRKKAVEEFDENIVMDNYIKVIHSIKL